MADDVTIRFTADVSYLQRGIQQANTALGATTTTLISGASQINASFANLTQAYVGNAGQEISSARPAGEAQIAIARQAEQARFDIASNGAKLQASLIREQSDWTTGDGGVDFRNWSAPASTAWPPALSWILQAIGVPSASAGIECAVLAAAGDVNLSSFQNTLAMPVSVATNAALSLKVATLWGSTGTGVNQIKLSQLVVEALN
ncbi:hypothetical protein [Methylocella silvestris]|uniref:hypothetical protein n=1 Tax=Methylocella silvestris TaxID=199596 RepID=UPI0015E0EE39|nr:hypothetical protein [Methylocella silvestris]